MNPIEQVKKLQVQCSQCELFFFPSDIYWVKVGEGRNIDVDYKSYCYNCYKEYRRELKRRRDI